MNIIKFRYNKYDNLIKWKLKKTKNRTVSQNIMIVESL